MSDTDTAAAELVVLSYPDELSEWGRDQVESDRYRGYFRRTLGTVTVGEIREEFVEREESIEGGWLVQSAAGPDSACDRQDPLTNAEYASATETPQEKRGP